MFTLRLREFVMRKLFVVTAMLVVLSFFAFALVMRDQTLAQEKAAQPAPKWEYVTKSFLTGNSFRDTEKALNDLGADGWEVCTASHTGGPINQIMVIFKRPKR